jgi:hypothetical protein
MDKCMDLLYDPLTLDDPLLRIMKTFRTLGRTFVFLSALVTIASCFAADKVFRAGAAISDISPTNFPVLVNAMFTERTATQTVDRLEARALVLDDGSIRICLTVVDSCMLPRDLIDRAKGIASKSTGLKADQMMISSTHTHSAPSAMGCLGSRERQDGCKSANHFESVILAHVRMLCRSFVCLSVFCFKSS